MDEKEMLPGTPPEECAQENCPAPLETEEKNLPEEPMDEFVVEVSEEEAEVLAEQDSLDGEPDGEYDEDTEEETSEEIAPDPLEIALESAVDAGKLTLDEADTVWTQVSDLGKALTKARGTIKKLGITIGCLVAALLISLAAVAGFVMKDQESQPFTGLVVGKSYASNITLPDYTTVTYTDSYVAPTDKDVEAKINEALVTAKKTSEQAVSGALQEGDVSVLDFTGYVDGKKLDSACATDQELELGSGKFIPGFEEGLIGKKVGEKVTLNLTFPADYSETSLQNKAVKFDVTIKSAKRTVYPALTDALVKEITEDKYATVAAYKAGLLEELDATAKQEAKDEARNEVWTNVAEGTKLKKYPKNMYNYYKNKLDEQYSSYYATYGVTDLEGFMTANKLDLDTYIKNQMIYEYAIYTIAAKQGITITDEDYTTMLTNYGCTTKAQLVEKLGVEPFELEASLLYDKVSNYLLEVATAK